MRGDILHHREIGLATQPSFDADLPSHACDLVGEHGNMLVSQVIYSTNMTALAAGALL